MKTLSKSLAYLSITVMALATAGCSQGLQTDELEQIQATTAPSPTYSDEQLDGVFFEVLGKTIDLAGVDFSEARVKECSDYIFISNADKEIHPVLQSCLEDSRLALKLLDSSTSQVIKDARDSIEGKRFSEEYLSYLNRFISAPDFLVREAPEFKKLCTRGNIAGELFNEKATECGISIIKVMAFARTWGEAAYDFTNR